MINVFTHFGKFTVFNEAKQRNTTDLTNCFACGFQQNTAHTKKDFQIIPERERWEETMAGMLRQQQ